VYPYSLEILGLEEVPCYSATNPGGHRFDVIRVLPTAIGVLHLGKPTLEHSWFPEFGWRMAHCKACTAHLGWSFSPAPKPPDPSNPGPLSPPNPQGGGVSGSKGFETKVGSNPGSPSEQGGEAVSSGLGDEGVRFRAETSGSGAERSDLGAESSGSRANGPELRAEISGSPDSPEPQTTTDSSPLDSSGGSALSPEGPEGPDDLRVDQVLSLIMNDDDEDEEDEDQEEKHDLKDSGSRKTLGSRSGRGSGSRGLAFHGIIVTRLREESRMPVARYQVAEKYVRSLEGKSRLPNPCRQS